MLSAGSNGTLVILIGSFSFNEVPIWDDESFEYNVFPYCYVNTYNYMGIYKYFVRM